MPSMYVAVIVIILGGIVLGTFVWYAMPDNLLKYLIILVLAIADLIAVIQVMSGKRLK